MTRISFIMPTFNRCDYISQSIESVLQQMTPDDEMIVVDDGSADATSDAVKPYLDRIAYVRQDNAGKSVALNYGLAETSGQYVWICDDDDLLNPGAVERLVQALKKSDADMVFGRYSRFCHRDGQYVEMDTGYWPDISSGSLNRHLLEDFFAFHNATLARRSLYNGLGNFDPFFARSQDYEMLVRIALTGKILYEDVSVFLQRQHEGARGPASQLTKATGSTDTWRRFDRVMFERLRDLVPQEYFTSMFDCDQPLLAERAGLLQRACILARHGLWDDALLDCFVAADILPGIGLHPLERAICRRVTTGKHGFAGLLAPDHAAGFARLARSGGQAQPIASEICRGLFWRLKKPNPSARNLALRHLLKPHSLMALARNGLRNRYSPAPAMVETMPDLAVGKHAMPGWMERQDAVAAQPSKAQ